MLKEKIVLDELYRCYSTMAMELDGRMHYFFASEEKGYPCYAFDAETFARKVVWEKAGGVMSMIAHPQKKNTFLAIRDFYLKESPSVSRLVEVTFDGSEFVQKDILHLPYLHRFDVFYVDQKVWVLANTIARNKKDKEDWSEAGISYMGVLEDEKELDLKIVKDGLFRNHGYSRLSTQDGGYITGNEGIFKIQYQDKKWVVEQLADQPTSEAISTDLDQDGLNEWLTIEPFHGNKINFYKDKPSASNLIWTYPKDIDFAHTLISAKTKKGPAFFGGIRRIHTDLFMLTMNNGKVEYTLLDAEAGPANLAFVHYKGSDIILSASHTANKIELYVLD